MAYTFLRTANRCQLLRTLGGKWGESETIQIALFRWKELLFVGCTPANCFRNSLDFRLATGFSTHLRQETKRMSSKAILRTSLLAMFGS